MTHTGFNNLRQIAAIGEVVLSTWKLISIDLTFTYYFYDRNVASFLAYINAPGAVRLGAGGFASSVTNFSQASTDLDLTVNPLDKWSVNIEIIESISVVDISIGWSYQGMVLREMGDWKVGLGAERDTSPSIGNNYYALAQVSYDF